MKNLLPLFFLFIATLLPAFGSNAPAVPALNIASRAFVASMQDQPNYDVELYPNPVTEGRLTITASESITMVQIVNITGKIVFNQEYQPNTTTVELELTKLEKGMYLVRIGFPGKEIHTEKIMVK